MAPRLTDRDHRLRAITEAELSEFIVGRPDLNRPTGLAQRLGWRVRVARRAALGIDSTRRKGQPAGDLGMRGYPDLTLMHRRQGRLIYAELKRETTHPTEHQAAWLDDLASLCYEDEIAGPCRLVEVYLWRPRHMDLLPALLGPRFGGLPVGCDLGAWPVPDATLDTL